MFEQFTKDARRAVTAAVEVAQKRSDTRIGNEHLLLGVPATTGAPAALDIAELRQELDRLDGRALVAVGIDPGLLDVGPSRSPEPEGMKHLPFTRAAKDTLTNALNEAIALDDRHIGVDHIALALTTLPESDRATRALAARGLDPDQLRRTLLETLRRAS